MPRLGSFSSKALTAIGLINRLLPPADPVPMIMEVSVDGNNALNFIKLGEGHDVEVDWGDGTIEQWTYSGGAGLAFHQYPAGIADTYTITISGYLPQFGTNSAIAYTDPIQGENFITRVLQWNNTTSNLRWAFEAQRLLTEVPNTLPPSVTDTTGMFWGCVAFGNTQPVIKEVDTDFFRGELSHDGGPFSVTSSLALTGMSVDLIALLDSSVDTFIGRSIIIEVNDGNPTSISRHTGAITSTNWVVGGGVDYVTFYIDSPLDGYFDITKFYILPPGTINDWDVSNVTDMSNMFEWCTTINCYLGDWDVSNVTSMTDMFAIQLADTTSTFSGLGIERWNIGNVTNTRSMFRGTSISAPIGSWDVSNVTNMANMFENAPSFNQPIGGWDVGNVTDFSTMFNGASLFEQNLSGWNTPLIAFEPSSFGNSTGVNPTWGTTTTPMIMTWTEEEFAYFYFWSGLADTLFPNACIDWGDGTRSTLTIRRNPPDYQYKSYAGLNHRYPAVGTFTITIRGYLPSFQGSMIAYGGPATPTTTGLTAVTEWNSTTVSLYGAFEHRTALTSVPNYLPSSVRDISAMFWEAAAFNDPNIAQWDVSLVTNMSDMFYSAASFNQDISNWDVTNIAISTLDNINDTGSRVLDPWYYPVWGTQGAAIVSDSIYGYSFNTTNNPPTVTLYLKNAAMATALRTAVSTRTLDRLYIQDTDFNSSYILDMTYGDFSATSEQAYDPGPGIDPGVQLDLILEFNGLSITSWPGNSTIAGGGANGGSSTIIGKAWWSGYFKAASAINEVDGVVSLQTPGYGNLFTGLNLLSEGDTFRWTSDFNPDPSIEYTATLLVKPTASPWLWVLDTVPPPNGFSTYTDYWINQVILTGRTPPI